MSAAASLYAAALEGAEPQLLVREEQCGSSGPLEIARFLGPLTAADADLLDRAAAPVLDVGCGPGRHVLALARRGVLAVGVDVSPAAVRHARDRGAAVIEANIFDRVPGAGTWGSALLLDGNIGIGGDPTALLTRIASLLRPGGDALVELDPPGTPPRAGRVRLEGRHDASEWFRWARVGADAVAPLAGAAGFDVADAWSSEGRWFARLVSR